MAANMFVVNEMKAMNKGKKLTENNPSNKILNCLSLIASSKSFFSKLKLYELLILIN